MPKPKQPPKVQAHIYFDAAIWKWLKEQAVRNGRTLQGEIVWRLQQQRREDFDCPTGTP